VPERVPSDHDALPTHRVNVETVGRTGRLRVPLPEAVDTDRTVVRLSLAGTDAHARVRIDLGGAPVVERAAPDAALARSGDGADLLADWLAEHGLTAGDAMVVDVLAPGYQYGLRPPGERVVYRVRDPPRDGLRDIAEGLDG